MAGFYERIRAMASSLLGRYGALVTVERRVAAEGSRYNPATGRFEQGPGQPEAGTEQGAGELITWTARAVKSEIRAEFLNDSSVQGGTRIRGGDMQIAVDCAGAPHSPQVGDEVIFPGGERWTVIRDMPVEPAGVRVLYTGLIRKG